MAFPRNLPAPFTNATAVTPHDSNLVSPLGNNCLWIGVAGAICVITKGGQTVTMTVPAGLFPLAVTTVKATGTTATGIFLLT